MIRILLFLFLSCYSIAQQNNTYKILANRASDSIPSLGSFLIWQNNQIVCEQYYNGANAETDFNMKSVTKSIVSAIAGIANDKGLLPNLNTPVLNILPQYDTDTSLFKKKITLKHLLSMQGGILWNDNNPPELINDDQISTYLHQKVECLSGTKFRYSTTESHLLGVALATCIKTDLKTFADTTLFNYLGIEINKWPNDKQGRKLGGSELRLKPKDMVQFGLLYLNNGKVNDKQVISKYWINESTSEQAILNEWDVLPNANGYGYYWWRRKINNHQAFVASGFGGQLICVIPDLKMIIVTTCFVNERNRGRSEIKRLHGFIDEIAKAAN